MSALVVAPVLVPLATAVLTAAVRERPGLQSGLSAAGVVLLLLCGVALVEQALGGAVPSMAFGGWAAPYGIEFRIDRTSAALLLITALMGAACRLRGTTPEAFRFRGVRPAFHTDKLTLNGWSGQEEQPLATVNHAGLHCMQATASWSANG